MPQPRFELYAFWRTSATYRVRVALAIKGLAADERVVDLDAGEQRDPSFLKLNPLAAIPALFDREGDHPQAALTQSLAILEYLEDVAPKPALLPADAYGRARVRSIAAMLAGDTHPFITPRVKKYLTGVGGFDDAAWRAWQTHWFTTGLQAVETRLAADRETGVYCHGDSVTIADICLASIVAVMRVFKIEVAEIPTVTRIVTACERQDAFAKAEPRRQVGARRLQPMARHIGIVGCSAEGAALCYRTICREGAESLGPHAHPEVSMHTHSLADYVACLDRGDLGGIADLMLSSAGKLAAAGAEILICPDNTIHAAMPIVSPRAPLPWLHIVDVVAEVAKHRGFRRLGLTGTAWLVASGIYPERLARHGLACVAPDEAERLEMGRLIMSELVQGVVTEDAAVFFRGVMERMKERGCEAVILGCTEIPLLMSDANSPLPTLDSTRLLARAALARAEIEPLDLA